MPTLSVGQEEVLAYVSHRTGLSLAGSHGRRLRETVTSAVTVGASPQQGAQGPVLDDETFEHICDRVTVQESFFFREQGKLAWLRDSVLPTLHHQSVPSVRAWSAGCATGEEAYTIAMLLTEAGLAGRYSVVGTDLSAAALRAAESATYGRWSLRGLDDATVATYFTEDDAGFHVREPFRAGVAFHQHNLLDPPPDDVGRCDLILCRNVLIYLTPEAVSRAVQWLVQALAPGGWLLVGASDPLLDGVDGLDLVFTSHGLAYRRRAPRPAQTAPPQPPKTVEPSPLTRVRSRVSGQGRSISSDPDLPALLAAGERALRLGQPRQAEVLARQAVGVSSASAGAHRLLVQALAESSRLREALETADRAVAAFPMDARLRHLHAAVLLESGDLAGSSTAARQAVYLEPGLAAAHLVLARSLELVGDHAAARRSRRHGHRLLVEEVSR